MFENTCVYKMYVRFSLERDLRFHQILKRGMLLEVWIFDLKDVKNQELEGSIFVCFCLFAHILRMHHHFTCVCALPRYWWVFWSTAASQAWRRSFQFFRSSAGTLLYLSGSRPCSLLLNFLWWGVSSYVSNAWCFTLKIQFSIIIACC